MRLAKLGIAMLFAVGLLFGTGASAQVVNDYFEINDAGIGNDAVAPHDAQLFAEDCGINGCGLEVNIFCGDPLANWVLLTWGSSHTDNIKLSASKAKLAQKAKGNQAVMAVSGGGTTVIPGVPVVCEQNKLTGDVSTKKMDGKAKVQAKNCTGLLAAELDYIDATCGTDLKALKIKRDGPAIKSIKVSLKGPALAP